MTPEQMPFAPATTHASPQTRPGMTFRKKLVLIAVPAALALVSVPVGIQAHGVANSHIAAVAKVHVTKSMAVKHATAAKLAVNTAVPPAEPADTSTDPAETGTGSGHADEVVGSTTENSVDHQFDGQE